EPPQGGGNKDELGEPRRDQRLARRRRLGGLALQCEPPWSVQRCARDIGTEVRKRVGWRPARGRRSWGQDPEENRRRRRQTGESIESVLALCDFEDRPRKARKGRVIRIVAQDLRDSGQSEVRSHSGFGEAGAGEVTLYFARSFGSTTTPSRIASVGFSTTLS